MRLPISWLKQFVPDLPSIQKLAEQLMMHGLEVERVDDESDRFKNIVVGQITDIRPHPNADKLRLAEVIIAPGGESQEIVCGAPNIAVGQKVPVALLGAKLPNGLVIEKRAIRGVESNGMLCAADELGIGRDHTGIMILEAKVKPGTTLTTALGLDEVVFDVSAPANRADLMAVRGLAWEIGAILSKTPKFTKVKIYESDPATQKSINVTVADPKQCPLYTARVVRGVTVRSSPAWLQQRLQAAGMRPINAIVDATNYVMLEYGQPLHAFDAAKITSGQIEVRAARAGEKLMTLDKQSRELEPNMLVIADPRGPIAIAGVMGGLDSEVTDATTDVILESAIFDPVSVRRTSRQLGLVSEASKRFEKGLWPGLTTKASDATAALITELCGGTAESGMVISGQLSESPRTVTIDPKYISERLGQPVTTSTSKKILTKLGFRVTGTKQWTAQVPEWRLDVSLPEDIVDEIGRLVGYDELPKSKVAAKNRSEVPVAMRFKAGLKGTLVELGFTEIISHAFLGERQGMREKGTHFEVANPLDGTQHQLRKGLFPQLFDVLKRQANAGEDAAIFELGRVFDPNLPGSVEQQQPWKLALGLTHKLEAQLPRIIKELQDKLKTPLQPEQHLMMEEKTRGRKIELCQFDIKALLADAKWEMPAWAPDKFVTTGVRYRDQSKYPAVKRDIAFWWPGTTAEIAETIDGLKLPLLNSYACKDRFTKDGKTSYAYNFVYRSPERTLTKAEVDELEGRIKAALIKGGAEIR